jgi:hypothetical protein
VLAEVCFPLFDTRFAREEAITDEKAEKPAPLWLYGEPPIERVGRFGSVSKRIPPIPYAQCNAGDVLSILHNSDTTEIEAVTLESVGAIADQYGHARLSVWLSISTREPQLSLADLVEGLTSLQVAVRHPDRRDVYEVLAGAGPALSDLYARESARTAKGYTGGYVADWVVPGRPFLIIVNSRRETLSLPVGLLTVPTDTARAGQLYFYPWISAEGERALAVWYMDAPRGGDSWAQPVDAVEELTSHYEELFIASALLAEAQHELPLAENYATLLERHVKRVSGHLRKERRHGVDLKAALRLLSDYDKSVLNPRQSSDWAETVIDRVNDDISKDIRFRMADPSFDLRRGNVTINYSGNVINYGIMADNTITVTNNLIDQAKAPSELKDLLKELRPKLLEAAKDLPEDEAKNLLKDYESFTETALREKPPKELVAAQGNQILSALKSAAAYVGPVTTIVSAILKLVVPS